MIKETRQYFCDACGKEITDMYIGRKEFITINDDLYCESEGMDFCKECMLSFREWLKTRKSLFRRREQEENA